MNKLLIIDDDPLIRNYLRVLFEEDYEVVLAENVAEGTDYVETYNPLVIISDIRMEPDSGLDFVEHLRTVLENETPVVLFSSSIDTSVEDFAKVHKNVWLLEKMIPPSEIKEFVTNIENIFKKEIK